MDGARYAAKPGLLNDGFQRILSRHTRDEMLPTRRAERFIEFHHFWGVDGVRGKRWISCKLQAIGVNKLSRPARAFRNDVPYMGNRGNLSREQPGIHRYHGIMGSFR
jgi:hypothetical protein